MWIRQVIVPGITDDESDLLALKEFIGTLKTVKKIDLIPYHTLGKYKWDQMQCEYPLQGVRPATDEDVEKVKKILEM